MLAHFSPNVSAGFRPALPARTGFYREPVAAGQLVCAADAGWPGAGWRSPLIDGVQRGAPARGGGRGGDGEYGNEQGTCDCEPDAASAAGLGGGNKPRPACWPAFRAVDPDGLTGNGLRQMLTPEPPGRAATAAVGFCTAADSGRRPPCAPLRLRGPTRRPAAHRG